MGKFLAAKITVEQIGMAIKLDQPYRRGFCQSTQNWQGDQMITSGRHGHDVLNCHGAYKISHSVQAVLNINRVGWHISHIGAINAGERRNPRDRVHSADHG